MKQNKKIKFCKYCGKKMPIDAVFCKKCGSSAEAIDNNQTNPYANNPTVNARIVGKKLCNKWVSLALCIFLGWCGAHKFYEGKGVKAVLYLLTLGCLGIACILDIFDILSKPNPYIP